MASFDNDHFNSNYVNKYFCDDPCDEIRGGLRIIKLLQKFLTGNYKRRSLREKERERGIKWIRNLQMFSLAIFFYADL